jgi:hypothetical protein
VKPDYSRPLELEPILKSAHFVAKGDWAPAYTASEYEDEMLRLAKVEARAGESPACAFARLCEEKDQRIESLFLAARRAGQDERRAQVEKRQDAFSAENAERLSVRRKAMEDMLARADRERRDDETPEKAFARLLDTDPAMGKDYRSYLGR